MYPVQMVTKMPKLKRENDRPRQEQPGSGRLSSFSVLLEHAEKDNVPENGCLVTYNAKSQLQTHYSRQSREYTY